MAKRAFTLIFPYYENPVMLKEQLQHLAGLPADVLEHLRVIVVDDGSPKFPLDAYVWAPAAHAGFALQVFRITVDVRWNWIAARNLAVSKAKTDWVLMTDIDHKVPEETMRRIIERKLSDRKVYRFSRVDAPDLTPYKPHPNSWLMTSAMFDKIGGYDERFSGFYGTDGLYRRRLLSTAPVKVLTDHLVRYEYVADSSTSRYGRKEPQDAKAKTLAASFPRGSKPKTLSFAYHEVTA